MMFSHKFSIRFNGHNFYFIIVYNLGVVVLLKLNVDCVYFLIERFLNIFRSLSFTGDVKKSLPLHVRGAKSRNDPQETKSKEKPIPVRRDDDGNPLYAQLPSRYEKQKMIEEKEKYESKLFAEKLAQRAKPVNMHDKEGNEYMYNNDGIKVKVEEYKAKLKEDEDMKNQKEETMRREREER